MKIHLLRIKEFIPVIKECTYIISTPNGTYINLIIPNFDTSLLPLTSNEDFLEIRDGKSDKSPLIGVYHGVNISLSIQSSHNFMWLRY